MIYDFTTAPSREHTNAEKYTLRKQLFGSEDVLPAWVADMDIATPDFVIEAVRKRLQHPIIGYEEFPESAKEAQIQWLYKYHGISLKSSELLYSHSVVASMSVFIQSFSEEGDEIIVQTPIYPPFFNQVKLNGRKMLLSPLKEINGHYGFEIEDLRKKITEKTKILLLCNPHNPVGRSWRKEELESLLAVCLEHDIKVFSDEIHCDIVYAPHTHTPFASLNGAGDITVSAYGVGKTFNMAGFAVSTVAIRNNSMFKRFKEVYDSIHFAQGSSLSHVAFEAAYTQGEQWLKELKAHLWHNYERLSKTLEPFAHLISLTPLQATYLAWLDCRGMGLNDKKLRKWFIEEAKLGLNPGLSFGRSGSGFMRLNFAVPTQTMDEILKRLHTALERYEN